MKTISKTVKTPAEYKDALDAADVLDLKLKEALGNGTWVTNHGETVWPSGKVTIRTVGYKYFEMKLGDDYYKVEPDTSRLGTDGSLTLVFTPK